MSTFETSLAFWIITLDENIYSIRPTNMVMGGNGPDDSEVVRGNSKTNALPLELNTETTDEMLKMRGNPPKVYFHS